MQFGSYAGLPPNGIARSYQLPHTQIPAGDSVSSKQEENLLAIASALDTMYGGKPASTATFSPNEDDATPGTSLYRNVMLCTSPGDNNHRSRSNRSNNVTQATSKSPTHKST